MGLKTEFLTDKYADITPSDAPGSGKPSTSSSS